MHVLQTAVSRHRQHPALPDPEAAFQNLLRYLKPGGEIQIYLYWNPEGQPIKRLLLCGGRVVILRTPATIASFFVWLYRLLKKTSGLKAAAEKLPMKQYAGFPFRVCVNDQLDRLSAPLEARYTRQEVAGWLRRANLEQTKISSAYGWVGTGRKPATSVSAS